MSFYTSQNSLTKHKQPCDQQEKTNTRTSNESRLCWKKHFHKNPFYFICYADSEADNEIDNSTTIGNTTTNIDKQNPVGNGHYIASEVNNVLKCDYFDCFLGYDNADWFVDEVIQLKNKKAFCFINPNEDMIKAEEDEGDCGNSNICRFCEKEKVSDKVRNHCHLTGKYRVPAHSNCNIDVTQKHCNFVAFIFHNFNNYDCNLIFKKLVDKTKDKVKFENVPKSNEEYISVTY